MNIKITKTILTIIGVSLILNGLINISDDGMILAYDITSSLLGFGTFTIKPHKAFLIKIIIVFRRSSEWVKSDESDTTMPLVFLVN